MGVVAGFTHGRSAGRLRLHLISRATGQVVHPVWNQAFRLNAPQPQRPGARPTTFGTDTHGAAVAGRPAAPSEADVADAVIVKLPTSAAKPGVRNVKGSATVTLTLFAVDAVYAVAQSAGVHATVIARAPSPV